MSPHKIFLNPPPIIHFYLQPCMYRVRLCCTITISSTFLHHVSFDSFKTFFFFSLFQSFKFCQKGGEGGRLRICIKCKNSLFAIRMTKILGKLSNINCAFVNYWIALDYLNFTLLQIISILHFEKFFTKFLIQYICNSSFNILFDLCSFMLKYKYLICRMAIAKIFMINIPLQDATT